MATRETRAPRQPAMPAVALIGALALAGCSSGHVGESWQCPLAETGTCDSVAAADPAVPDPAVAPMALRESLWHVRGEPPPDAPAACASDCGGGFDPFAWLARLFGSAEDAGAALGAGTRRNRR